MLAVVFHGPGDIRLEDVPEPVVQHPTDAIVRITESAICGTDLHFVRGTFSGMRPGTILGHEAVGVVEEIGTQVRNVRAGDRVIVPSTVACGYCAYCRAGYHAQCDHANPNGPLAGTVFFGGPEAAGALPGLQAEYARVPFANTGLVKIPDAVSDDQALLLSDIFPTGHFAAELAEIVPGDTVAVFGCGPVGLFAIIAARLAGAGRILAVDSVPDRLALANREGAEIINFDAEDPVQAIRELTGGIGVDRAIDAVGVDACRPRRGPAAQADPQAEQADAQALAAIAPQGGAPAWHGGDAPTQALRWAVQGLAKAGTLGIVGVYPPQTMHFPLGLAMGKNLTINAGNCNHRRHIPELLNLVAAGVVDPAQVLTQSQSLPGAIAAYHAFDERAPGWSKVKLAPMQPELEYQAASA